MYSIKFNHIQDLGDARYASAVLSDFIGFSIDGEFSITPQVIQEIIGWCAGPKLILEINQSPNFEQIESWLNILPIDGIQCSQENLDEIKNQFPDVGIWLTFNDFISVKTSPESANEILEINTLQFSINCFKESETGKKDYSEWNDFFEKLEIF
jgi:hypothetical protein